VKVEGPVLMSLIDDGEVACRGGGDVACSGGLNGSCGADLKLAAALSGMNAVEVDLDWISFSQLRRGAWGGTKDWGPGLGGGRRALDGFDNEKVGVGREDQGSEAALG
jgi:hypothetical protein